MTKDRPRDTQRAKLYKAEEVLMTAGQTGDPALQSREALQSLVDGITQAAWFQRRWGSRRITVKLGRGGGHASVEYSEITLGRWGRQVPFVCHEIAHLLAPRNLAAHGPEYAGVYLTLIEHVMGEKERQKLSDSFRLNRVRWTTKAVPAPTQPVVTQAERVAKKRALATRPPSQAELRHAADVIHRAVANDHFGPVGRKPRIHALEVARKLLP